jgi:hypothetical protein
MRLPNPRSWPLPLICDPSWPYVTQQFVTRCIHRWPCCYWRCWPSPNEFHEGTASNCYGTQVTTNGHGVTCQKTLTFNAVTVRHILYYSQSMDDLKTRGGRWKRNLNDRGNQENISIRWENNIKTSDKELVWECGLKERKIRLCV